MARVVQQHMHRAFLDTVEEEAHRRRIFGEKNIADWLGIALPTWWRWRRGGKIYDSTVGRVCARLQIKKPDLRKRTALTPSSTMLDGVIRAAAEAETSWYRWLACGKLGSELLPWLTRQNINATLIATMGGPPVRLTFSIGQAESDTRRDYELRIEPTHDLWLSLIERVGITEVLVMEGNTSPTILTDIVRYVRILTKQVGRVKGRSHDATTATRGLRSV